MPFNKLGTTQALLPPLPVALNSGETFNVPSQNGYLGQFSSYSPIQTGSTMTGQYIVSLGAVCELQIKNSSSQQWNKVTNALSTSADAFCMSSDGTNYRVANTTDVPTGGTITNAGSGLTNGYNTVAVTPSVGGSTWNTIVGGAINTTITITTAGTGYVAPPILVFVPPQNQGSTPYVLPTAYCTISGGAINAVTVLSAGAGLVSAPTIQVIPQSFDTTGGGGVLTVNATLAGSGTLTAISVNTYGTAVGGAAPTLTFVPASTIAVTALTNTTTSTPDTVTFWPI